MLTCHVARVETIRYRRGKVVEFQVTATSAAATTTHRINLLGTSTLNHFILHDLLLGCTQILSQMGIRVRQLDAINCS